MFLVYNAPMNEKNIKRSQKERRAESDQRIIEAAIELFALRGYQKTSLIHIGQKAGFTGTLISNRFGSKERLLRAVLAHILNRFEADEPVAREQSASRQLEHFVATYIHDACIAQSRIRALYVIIGEALGSISCIENEVVKVNRVFRNRIEEFINLGMTSGEFSPKTDSQAQAIIIVGLLRGVTMQVLAEPTLNLKQLIPEIQMSILSPLLNRSKKIALVQRNGF